MDWARILAYITGTVDQEFLLRNQYNQEKTDDPVRAPDQAMAYSHTQWRQGQQHQGQARVLRGET
jgi:hypothetical protein